MKVRAQAGEKLAKGDMVVMKNGKAFKVLHDQNMAILNNAESERDFQQKVVDYALLRGWHAHAVLDTRISAKRQGQTGFPDIVLARKDGRLLFVECKSQKGKPTVAQLEWADVIIATGNQYQLWRPADWEKIEEYLK